MAGVYVVGPETPLTFLDTGPGSTVWTDWGAFPDRATAKRVVGAADYLLNAAAVSWERLEAAYRVKTPGSRLQGYGTDPNAFWRRVWRDTGGLAVPTWLEAYGPAVTARMGAVGAQARHWLGDLDRAAYNGLLLDDANDGATVTGWQARPATTNDFHAGASGTGPGRGGGASRSDNHAASGGGGAAAAGGDGSDLNRGGHGGEAVPAEYVLKALTENDYSDRAKWLASGSGGNASAFNRNDQAVGGVSGSGLARIALGDLTESANRSLTGGAGVTVHSAQHSGGGGGGTLLNVCGGSYTLPGSRTVNCAGGAVSNLRAGRGSNGHMIVAAGGSITIAGRRTNAELTEWRFLAAAIFPGGIVSG